MSLIDTQLERPSTTGSVTRLFPESGTSYILVGLLAAVAALASALTFFTPELLTGPAAMNGSARGTALVVLLDAFVARGTAVIPARGIALYLWIVAAVNTVAWLGGIAPPH